MKEKINTKTLTNIILAIIFVVAVYCGVIGWKEYYLGEKLHLSFWSSLYLTLQLISKSTTELINNGAYPPRLDVPGSLQIARFLMPLVILSAVVNVILGMTKKKLDLYLIKYFFHDHFIFCGLNKKTEYLINDILLNANKEKDLKSGAKIQIVIIEINPDQKSISTLRRRNVKVIIGDARDPKLLRQANIGRANYLTTLINDDSLNFEIIDAIKNLKETLLKNKLKVLCQFGEFDNLSLAKDYQQIESKLIEYHYIDFYQKAASKIIDEYSPDIFIPIKKEVDPPAKIMIYGLNKFSEKLLIEAGHMYHFANFKRTKVTIVDYGIDKKLNLLKSKYPALDVVLDLETIDTEKLLDPHNQFSLDNLSVCFITGEDDCTCLVESMKIRQFFYSRLKSLEFPKVVTILPHRHQITGFLTNLDTKFADINIEIKDIYKYLDKKTIIEDKELIDIAAKQIFDIYPDKENRKFENLSDREKDMNRFSARHLLVKFRYLDMATDRNYQAIFEAVNKTKINISSVGSEILCRMEHKRWCAEKLLTGFIRGEVVQDKNLKNTLKNSLKYHPLICDFEELDAKEQAKDLGPFFATKI